VAKSMATLMRTKKPSWRSPIVTEESIKMLRLAAQSIRCIVCSFRVWKVLSW
jgi:hypothetical protein